MGAGSRPRLQLLIKVAAARVNPRFGTSAQKIPIMASEQSDAKPLELRLFNDDDDEEDLLYKKKLYALVNGDVTSSQAATDFDAWIVDEANTRLKEFMKRPDLKNLTSEEEERGIVSLRALAPNPSGDIEMVFKSVARLCSAFPPYHPGQDRIIHFLEALRAVPEHQVPDGAPKGDSDDHDQMITLWPFGGNWMALAELFRREGDGISPFFFFLILTFACPMSMAGNHS